MGTRQVGRGRGAVALAVLVVAVAASGCSGSTPDAATGGDPDPAGPAIETAGVRIERTYVGPAGSVDDVEAVEGSVVVLASSMGDRADIVLHSPDGGRTWDRSTPGLPTGGTPSVGTGWMLGPEEPLLFGAGSTVFASRTWSPSAEEPTAPRSKQALRVSNDGGASWSAVDLPVPPDHQPIVSASGMIDGTIVLAGTLQRDRTDGEPTGITFHDLDAYDAAAWTSSDYGGTFERVEGAPFADQPGMQVVRQIVDTGDRLVAIGWDTSLRGQGCCFPSWGASSWATTDGATWTRLRGLDAGPGDSSVSIGTAPARVHDGDLEIGDVFAPRRLVAGTSDWVAIDQGAGQPPNPEDRFDPNVDALFVGDQAYVGTWVYDAACDCEIAGAGRAELDAEPAAIGADLTFDDCTDTSVRGQTGVASPHRLGSSFGALSWCNDYDRLAAAWAGSTDGGSTWTTTRLTELAPSGSSDLLVATRPFTQAYDAEAGDDLVIALQGDGTDEDGPDRSPARPGRVVLLSVSTRG